jgi:hypothetical protein
MRFPIRPAALALALAALCACSAQLGPRALPAAREGYGEAIARSSDEQLLLNLVRLRYRDNPLFLEVGSVVTHFSLTAGATASAGIANGTGTARTLALGGSLGYAEDPTVTYAPLQGEDFAVRLLSPISPTNLVLLSQSGWSVERLMLCCVQRVNGLKNAISAAGPTPDLAPDFADFQRLARLLRQLQIAGLLEVEPAEDGKTLLLRLDPTAGGPHEEEAREVHRLLGAGPEVVTFRIVSALAKRKPDEVALTGRSLLSVLFYLSQAVEAPAADEAAGRVTVTRGADGRRLDWAAATGGLFRVHSSAGPPADAAVAVRYRGSWFYIADADLNSKTTFSLLSYLFALKAGGRDVKEPVLTLGVQ